MSDVAQCDCRSQASLRTPAAPGSGWCSANRSACQWERLGNGGANPIQRKQRNRDRNRCHGSACYLAAPTQLTANCWYVCVMIRLYRVILSIDSVVTECCKRRRTPTLSDLGVSNTIIHVARMRRLHSYVRIMNAITPIRIRGRRIDAEVGSNCVKSL